MADEPLTVDEARQIHDALTGIVDDLNDLIERGEKLYTRGWRNHAIGPLRKTGTDTAYLKGLKSARAAARKALRESVPAEMIENFKEVDE